MNNVVASLQTRLLFKCQVQRIDRQPNLNLNSSVEIPAFTEAQIEASPVLSDFLEENSPATVVIAEALRGPLFITSVLYQRVDENVFRDICGDLLRCVLESIIRQIGVFISNNQADNDNDNDERMLSLLGYWIKQGEFLELIVSQLHEDAVSRAVAAAAANVHTIEKSDKTANPDNNDNNNNNNTNNNNDNNNSDNNNNSDKLPVLQKMPSWSDSLIDLLASDISSNFINIALIQVYIHPKLDMIKIL